MLKNLMENVGDMHGQMRNINRSAHYKNQMD